MKNKATKIHVIILYFIAFAFFAAALLFSLKSGINATINGDTPHRLIIILSGFILGILSYYAALRAISLIIWAFESRKAERRPGYIPFYNRKKSKPISKDVSIMPYVISYVLIFLSFLFLIDGLSDGYGLMFGVSCVMLIAFIPLVIALSVSLVNMHLYFQETKDQFFKLSKDNPAVIGVIKPSKNSREISENPPFSNDSEIKSSLKLLDAACIKVNNAEITSALRRIARLIEKIYKYKNTYIYNEDAARKITAYYVPTAISLCDTYISVYNAPVPFDGQERILSSIINALESIYAGLLKMKTNMLENTELNINAEIEALNSMLAFDGLLGDQITEIHLPKQNE